ncbi:MAG: PotD/PotF family extracellular solute-binding protein [Anaerolineae bacterium]|jgi:spermidine/putrescine-binding protein
MKRVFALVLVLTVLAGLAGCGSTPEPAAPTAAPTSEGPAPEPTSPPLAEELHVYNWSEYIDPAIYDEFEQEFGVKVIEDTFASNEDLLAKLQAGATGYDIIVPSDYMVTIMRELDLLTALDYGNIPNFANIDPKFLDPPYDPSNTYCVPYQWGTTGIGYDSEVFEEAPASWAYLFDPEMAGPYANQMSMLNDAREVFAAALKYLGYSLNTTNEQELEEAKQLLIQQKAWVSTYDSEGFEDLLAAGETVLAHGWSGDFFMAAEEAEQVWYVIPEEGGVIWTDNLCIPKSAPNKYTAEVFIDFLLRPEIGAQITNYTWYGSPNLASEEFIDAEILEEPAIYPPPEVMEKLEFIRDVGEATAIYDRMWTEIKTQ